MQLTCPRCAIPLVHTRVEWVSACGRCGGIFAARTVGPVTEPVASAAAEASSGATVRASTAARVACPSCRRPSSRESFRGIEVDRCAEHGIWFDRDELDHVLARTRPETLKGLGAVAAGAASATAAASLAGRTVDLSGKSAIDLADIGLEVAVPAIHAGVEQSDAEAWMVVNAVAGLFDR